MKDNRNELKKHKKSDAVKWIVVFVAIILLAVSVAAAITRGFTTANPWGWLDTPNTDTGKEPSPEVPDDKIPATPEEPAFDWSTVYEYESIFDDNGVQHLSITGFKPGKAMREIVIPAKIRDAVIGVSSMAFKDNETIEKVVIEDGVEFLGDYAFANMENLETVIMKAGNSLGSSIGECIFRYCSELETVELSEGLTFISPGMFQDSCSIKRIIIPSTVTSVEIMAFSGWTSEQTIYVRPGVNITDSNISDYATIVRDYTGD